MQKLTNYLRTRKARTEFRATTFQTICYQLKQNNNLTVQFESQQYKNRNENNLTILPGYILQKL